VVRSLGGAQVEGVRAVRELLTAGRRPVYEVLVADRARLEDLVAEAHAHGVPVRVVETAELRRLARSHQPQGVIARAAPLVPAPLASLVGARLVVVLDHVLDPQNLGAICRSAAGAGADAVVVPERRSALVTPVVTKVAAGSLEHLPIVVTPGIPQALRALKRLGLWTLGLDSEATESLFASPLIAQPLAFVLGSEGAGLARLVREELDAVLSIPMSDAVASLNVAAAAAVALFAARGARDG